MVNIRKMNIDTNDTVIREPVGNSKSCLRARFWFFTWNNYPENWRDTITQGFVDASKYAVNPEEGKQGTPHLQGVVEYKHARSFDSMKKLFPCHWEKCISKKAVQYCTKLDTQVGDPLIKGYKKIKPLIKEFKDWQLKLNDIFKEDPDSRKIYWVVDPVGGAGKTTYCKHLVQTRDDTLYVCGKAGDIKYGISSWLETKELRIVLLDYTRSLENYVSYEGLESIKNGIFFNTKYESRMVCFDTTHVVCFSNFEPNMDMLSGDRWVVIHLNNEPLRG